MNVPPEARLNAVFSRFAPVYRREKRPMNYAEQSYLVDLMRRPGFESELETILSNREKLGSWMPHSLTALLSAWDETLDKIATMDWKRPENRQRPASIQDLRAVIQVKEEKAKALRDRYATEGPVSTDWSSDAAKREYIELRREIKALKLRMEQMV